MRLCNTSQTKKRIFIHKIRKKNQWSSKSDKFFCLLWFRCVKPQSNFDKWRVTGFILFISLHIAVSDGLKVNYLVWTLYMITSYQYVLPLIALSVAVLERHLTERTLFPCWKHTVTTYRNDLEREIVLTKFSELLNFLLKIMSTLWKVLLITWKRRRNVKI